MSSMKNRWVGNLQLFRQTDAHPDSSRYLHLHQRGMACDIFANWPVAQPGGGKTLRCHASLVTSRWGRQNAPIPAPA